MSDRDVDDRLEAAGRSWRDAHAELPLPVMRAARRSRWSLASPLVATLVVGAAVVLVLGLPHRQGSETGATPPASPQFGSQAATPQLDVIEVGDRVAATGVISVGAAGSFLCSTDLVVDVANPSQDAPPPTCTSIKVPLTGPVDTLVSDWHERDGTRYSSVLRVSGTWTGAALAATDVGQPPAGGPASSGTAALPSSCVPIAATWTRDDLADAQGDEAALARLADAVRGNPSVYAGAWRAYVGTSATPDDRSEQPSGVVVGTVADVEAARSYLATIYPGNLCVVGVDHSLDELERVAAAIEQQHATWRVDVAVPLNGVNIVLPILDNVAATELNALQVSYGLLPWMVRE